MATCHDDALLAISYINFYSLTGSSNFVCKLFLAWLCLYVFTGNNKLQPTLVAIRLAACFWFGPGLQRREEDANNKQYTKCSSNPALPSPPPVTFDLQWFCELKVVSCRRTNLSTRIARGINDHGGANNTDLKADEHARDISQGSGLCFQPFHSLEVLVKNCGYPVARGRSGVLDVLTMLNFAGKHLRT